MLRVATLNIENLDDPGEGGNPALSARVPVLQDILTRLNADILCLQEVHGQELPDHTSDKPSRNLSALDAVVAGTQYADFNRAHTVTSDNIPYNQRNLVVLSAFPIDRVEQYRNEHIDMLQYRKVTASPVDDDAKNVTWERPILHVVIRHPELEEIHIVNLHLKSRLASNIPGQKDGYSWKSAAGWAEGYFLSSIKRVGQALETRILVDAIFDENSKANVIVCGDFNAEPGEVPVEAIAGRVENTDNTGLRPNVLIPCSSGVPESIRFTHYHQGQGNLLDHMMISQSLLPRFKEAEIHNENLHDESLKYMFDDKYPEPDHAGFVSIFR